MTRDVVQAIKFARTMSNDVTAVHVTDDVEAGERLRDAVRAPAPRRRRSSSSSRRTASSFGRSSATSRTRRDDDGDDVVIVLLPEYVPRHWWERFLYNENGRRIRRALLGRPDMLVADVPFRRGGVAGRAVARVVAPLQPVSRRARSVAHRG